MGVVAGVLPELGSPIAPTQRQQDSSQPAQGEMLRDNPITPQCVMGILEIVITAARDGVILTVHENNQKIYMDLMQKGLINKE